MEQKHNNNNSNNKIQILPEFIANQIAAGEVVQRPESVVKELVENAIDANANSIAVFINDAGKSLIHIVDNGVGMSKEDLALAPLRHATSKIHTSQDLEEIRTFGFRGEAIPSISSVALLEIRTKQKDDEHGWKLISEPQKEFVIEPVTLETGTHIFVKNLFYNVPARRKFLKSNPTEQKYIYETIQKFALSNPDKRFVFYDNDSLIFDVKPESLDERIKSVLKINSKNSDDAQLLEVNFEVNDIQISGFVGQPQLARKSNPIQYFFLNGRTINSKYLSHSVYSAFEHLIDKNLKPFFILNIKLDYKTVDVNVHPQKSEVKFEDEKLVYSCIRKAVQEALKLHNFVPDLAAKPPMNFISNEILAVEKIGENEKQSIVLVDKITGEIYDSERIYSNQENYNQSNFIRQNSDKQSDDSSFFKNLNRGKYNYNNLKFNKSLNALYGNFNKDLDENTYQTPSEHYYKNDKNGENTITENSHSNENFAGNFANDANDKLFDENITSENCLNNLWQFHSKYIFLQTNAGLVAIDQHNAHERIIYEQLTSKIKTGNILKQNLLFPVETNLNSTQVLVIKEIESELFQIGFSFSLEKQKDGNDILTIFSQPSDLNFHSAENTFIEILDAYIHSEELEYMNKHEKISATVACQSAIKAGQKLSQEEMKNIVINLFNCEMPHICPHGRAILFQFSLDELDKKFGRR